MTVRNIASICNMVSGRRRRRLEGRAPGVEAKNGKPELHARRAAGGGGGGGAVRRRRKFPAPGLGQAGRGPESCRGGPGPPPPSRPRDPGARPPARP